MPQLEAHITLNPEQDSATVRLVPVGTTELEHELLVEFFKARGVSLVAFSKGDAIEARFVIQEKGAFIRAQRAVENRIRARDGRISLEEQEKIDEARKQADAKK